MDYFSYLVALTHFHTNCDCIQRLQPSSVGVNKISLCSRVRGDHPNRTCKYLLVSPLSSHTHAHTNTPPQPHTHNVPHNHTCTDTRVHIQKHTQTQTHPNKHIHTRLTQTHTCTDTRAHIHKHTPTQTHTHTHTHTHTYPHSSELCMMFIISCRHIPFSKLSQLSRHMLLVHSGGEDSTVYSGMW